MAEKSGSAGNSNTPYNQDAQRIETDQPETQSESYTEARESARKPEMITFSIRLPREQKDRLERYAEREKGQGLGPLIRQIVTEYMRRERLW